MDSPFFIRVYQKTLEFSRVIDNILNNTELREYYSQFGVDFSIIIEPMNKIINLYEPLAGDGSLMDIYESFRDYKTFVNIESESMFKSVNGVYENLVHFLGIIKHLDNDIFIYSSTYFNYNPFTKEIIFYELTPTN